MKKVILFATMMVSSLSTFAQKDTIFITKTDTVYITRVDTVYVTRDGSAQGARAYTQANHGQVPYIVANNYFVRNNVKTPVYPIITDAGKFESTFGMATTMGGSPTPIDFSRQFVIAIVLPVTDISTRVEPTKLTVTDQRMDFTYTVTKGKKMSSAMQPSLILIVDKQYKRNDFQSQSKAGHNIQEDEDDPLIMEINPEEYKNQRQTVDE